MKKIYCTLILLTTVMAGFSQTEKGSVLLGGNIDFTSTSKTYEAAYQVHENATSFALNPMIGFFPVNNFAVILNTNYETESSKIEGQNESISSHTLVIGPLLRYYFPASESVKFFAGAGIGFGSGNDMTSTVYQVQAGPAFYISRNLALEFNVNYQSANNKYTSSIDPAYNSTVKQSQFGVAVGFMVYLGKGKK
jgi:opacity protein-like surface antigen